MNLNLSAKQSPRFENDKIMWYEGDTFQITWDINLTDADTGDEITLSPLDDIIFRFNKANKSLLHEFVAKVNSEGKVVLDFNTEISKKFIAGSYTYSIKYKGVDTTTIATNGKVEVETCQ